MEKLNPKMRGFTIILLLLINQTAFLQENFEQVFTGERLRVEFTISCQPDTTDFFGVSYFREPLWSGPRNLGRAPFSYGELQVSLHDPKSGIILYSIGYSSLYNEWKAMPDHRDTTINFRESVLLPYPSVPLILRISERNPAGDFTELLALPVQPEEITPVKLSLDDGMVLKTLKKSGSPAENLDLVFVSVGYAPDEEDKFFSDAARFAASFSRWAPYDSYLDCFNIVACFIPSGPESGENPDSVNPHSGISASFNALGIARYMMTRDLPLIHEYLAGIACDQVIVVVNDKRYGGGGIYNYLTLFTGGNVESEFLFQHEFAHAFACLADEYYTSRVTYNEIYPLNREPYQPNITTLVDFDSKWSDLVNDTVPVPTPNRREYAGIVGVFEGAGYRAEGMYRSSYNCAMKSSGAGGFCPVCRLAIQRMLDYYCKTDCEGKNE